MIQFTFNERRAAQAAARILRRHGKPMPAAKLAQLLYLADRRQLVERGIPITGAQFVSAPNGAELTEISQLLASPTAEWSRHVVQAEDLRLCAAPPPSPRCRRRTLLRKARSGAGARPCRRSQRRSFATRYASANP